MNKNISPLWYHPTTVLAVDDDVQMLRSLERKMDALFPPVTFTSPRQALDYLQEKVLPLERFSQQIITDIDPSEEKFLSTENIALDFSPLRSDLEKPDRFSRVVVALVDRAMHEMDGLDFCKKVRELGLPVKLILLTGHTQESEAVNAFNHHLIDAFVQKSADLSAMIDKVNPCIQQLAFQVFCESSQQLLGPIVQRVPLLTNEKIALFFKHQLKEQKAVEYYLLDTSGTSLLITAEGIAKIVLLKTEQDFEYALELLEGNDDESRKIATALKTRSAFPFSPKTPSFYDLNPTEWKNAMTPMKKESDLNIYYGVTASTLSVLSFDHYANKIWRPKV